MNDKQRVYRSDYQPSDYHIESVALDFQLADDVTIVTSDLQVRRRPSAAASAPLVLHGEELDLQEVAVDGQQLTPAQFERRADALVVPNVGERFALRTVVHLRPHENTALMGLYRTQSSFCTQCEAMGFRRITYYLDRPDVMSCFRVTITADKQSYPVLLSNGNRIAQQDLPEGRHQAVWEDPFPKPSYLFALVAGDLRCHRGAYTTRGGREVQLEIWVEPENIDRCEHALQSLIASMRWDEERFGLEYDLDVYMIVAVDDFNMGAMENKGLNVFNSKYVLADPRTATDADYERIEGVIGHEYFHNWTGNRVTCRDWFQLTLKEGLTVFRDQLFTADTTSAPVKRIIDVRQLRSRQFAEDAGPMSHPIRPESYISMDNFYTATVYEKGAEVVRMYQTLLGADGFRRGMDLYFERHDGQAVTCDDFRAAMADANDADLEQFSRWYSRAGTPVLRASDNWDAGTGTYRLQLSQASGATEEEAAAPLHMPVAVGLLDSSGRDIPARLKQEADGSTRTTHVLSLRESSQTFEFEGVAERPRLSLLRGYSAPVRVEFDRSPDDLAFLMAHDSDPFQRWDAGQTLATSLMIELTSRVVAGRQLELETLYVDAYGAVLRDTQLDGALKGLALTLPDEITVGQSIPDLDPSALHTARQFMRRTLVAAHEKDMVAEYDRLRAAAGSYSQERTAVQDRQLKNTLLQVLAAAGDDRAAERAAAQFEASDNMTDSQAALAALCDLDCSQRDAALEGFYQQWRSTPLVLDKWFAVQAGSRRADALEQVVKLAQHDDFTLTNPNRVYALIGAFCLANQAAFHTAGGGGYAFLADHVIQLNQRNPQVASRMVSALNGWRRFDAGRRELMQQQLKRILDEDLCKDVYEIVERALA